MKPQLLDAWINDYGARIFCFNCYTEDYDKDIFNWGYSPNDWYVKHKTDHWFLLIENPKKNVSKKS